MRNRLSLQKNSEEAFDNCWVAVISVDSVEPNLTEWKYWLFYLRLPLPAAWCPPAHRLHLTRNFLVDFLHYPVAYSVGVVDRDVR